MCEIYPPGRYSHTPNRNILRKPLERWINHLESLYRCIVCISLLHLYQTQRGSIPVSSTHVKIASVPSLAGRTNWNWWWKIDKDAVTECLFPDISLYRFLSSAPTVQVQDFWSTYSISDDSVNGKQGCWHQSETPMDVEIAWEMGWAGGSCFIPRLQFHSRSHSLASRMDGNGISRYHDDRLPHHITKHKTDFYTYTTQLTASSFSSSHASGP